MTSPKEEKWNKILISIAIPAGIIIIILSFLGKWKLPSGVIFVLIAALLFAAFAKYNSVKKKNR